MDTVDYLPELYPYRDEGCALSPSCLHCPFPSCLDERPRGRQGWLKEQRSREIALLHSRGKSTRDLARIFGTSQRTIQRTLSGRKSDRRRILPSPSTGEGKGEGGLTCDVPLSPTLSRQGRESRGRYHVS